MSELRLNLITNTWVIIAGERAHKPADFRLYRENHHLPERLDSCPFCPGNEVRTPPEILNIPGSGVWKVRVIPNMFAAVRPAGERIRTNNGLRHSMSGIGRHEVIIETPRHDLIPALLDPSEIADILTVYRNRFINAYTDSTVEHVVVFKNHGAGSGTNITHAHSQLIALPVTPLQMRLRVEETRRFFDNTGECLMCVMLRDERRDGTRIVVETEHFVAFVPYAALSPFHLWLFPRRHSQSFADITDDEVRDLAENLRLILLKLHKGLNNPDFNYSIRSERPNGSVDDHFHWYISIVPRLIQPSGIELGTGIYLNISVPEEVAAFLRAVPT
jgi:UDPglucose--hexose-1-phosphate uridylyltransferase